MRRVIKNQKKMKNTMYIVFGVFALALFVVTMMNPSYANEGLIIDDALDKIVEQTITSNNVSEEDSEVSDESLELDEDIEDPELTPEEKIAEGDKSSQDLENDEEDDNEYDNNDNEHEENLDGEGVNNGENDENSDEEGEIEESYKASETEEGNNELEVETSEIPSNEESEGVINRLSDVLNNNEGMENMGFFEVSDDKNTIEAIKSVTLLPGCQFNGKIKSLAKGSNVTCWDNDSYITRIEKVTQMPAGARTGVVSIDGAQYPVVAGYLDDVIYYQTEADKIYLNEDSSYMFNLMYKLKGIDIDNFDASNVQNMNRMFAYLSKNSDSIELNLNGWITDNLTNVESIFEYANISKLYMEGWNLSNLTKGEYIFLNASSLTHLYASGWITPSKMSYSNMMPSNLEYIDVTNWNLTGTTDLNSLFINKKKLSSVVGLNTRKNTNNLVNLSHMFDGTTILTDIDMEGLNFENVTNVDYMFGGLNKDINLSGVNLKSLTSLGGMFNSIPKTLNMSHIDLRSVTNLGYLFQSTLESIDLSYANLSGVTSMGAMFINNTKLRSVNMNNIKLNSLKDSSYMFLGCSNLTEVNLINFDTTNLTNVDEMFTNCTNLNTVYIGKNFEVEKIRAKTHNFQGNFVNGLIATFISGKDFNKKIKTLVEGESVNYDKNNFSIKKIKRSDTIDDGVIKQIVSVENSEDEIYVWLSGLDTIYWYTEAGKIEMNRDSSYMFYNMQGLEELDLNTISTNNVININSMFEGDSNLKTIYATKKFKINEGVTAINMFKSAINIRGGKGTEYNEQYIDGHYARTDKNGEPGYFTNMATATLLPGKEFNAKIKSIASKTVKNYNDEDYNIINIKESKLYFEGVEDLLSITNSDEKIYVRYDESDKTVYRYTEAGKIEMSPDSSFMFYNLRNVKQIDLKGIYTNNVTNMLSMFQNCSALEEIYVNNFNTSNILGDYSAGRIDNMFNGCESLTDIDVSNFETKQMKTINSMFSNCANLEKINMEGWDFSNYIGGGGLFSNTESLDYIIASGWTLPDSTNSFNYFGPANFGNSSIKKIDVSNRQFKNPQSLQGVFQGIGKLNLIKGLETWDTTNVVDMSFMFQQNPKLVELNLGSRNTENVINMAGMFNQNSGLNVIYVSDEFSMDNVTNSGNMFQNAISLVGGNGTTFNPEKIDGEYARIDISTTPGYFTNILDKPYTITYNTNGGLLSGEKTIYTQRDSFILPTPIKTGYSFLGWTGSNGLEPELVVNIAEFTVGDLEYTANWGIGKYKILFDTDGGNTIKPIEKDYNSLLSGMNLPTPTKECNAFSGWDIELPERMPAHDITLKAIWNYTCSRSSGGGGAKKSETTTREVAVETPTEKEHNSANEENKTETPITTPSNDETSNQVISVTQEVSEDGIVEAVVETIKIKNTDIVATVRTEVNPTNSSSSSSSSATHTKEQNDAYSFAKSNGITTTESIEEAKMNTELTRIQMAKMLSNFAINVLGQEPDTEKGMVNFDDVTNKMDKQYDNAVTKAYQLGIMGQNVKNNEFRPNDTVTRAEFASSLSRLLYHTEEGEYKGTGKYYIPHIAKLYNEGIINKADPKIKEKRGYVMTMLMRTVE